MQSFLLLLAFMVGGAGGYFLNNLTRTVPPAEINEVVKIYDAGDAQLPTNSVQIQDCKQGRGYTLTETQYTETGPAFLMWENKIIGIEYYLTLNPNQTANLEQLKNLNVFNAKINHLDVTPLKNELGKPNKFGKPNWVATFYLVYPSDLEKITCINAPKLATGSASLTPIK